MPMDALNTVIRKGSHKGDEQTNRQTFPWVPQAPSAGWSTLRLSLVVNISVNESRLGKRANEQSRRRTLAVITLAGCWNPKRTGENTDIPK